MSSTAPIADPAAPATSRVAVFDTDVAGSVADRDGLDGYASAQILVRFRGEPIGYVRLPVRDGRVPGAAIVEAARREHRGPLNVPLARAALGGQPRPSTSVTAVVCTRNRPADLARCLGSLLQLRYPHLDLLVVDNAPSNDDSKRLVLEHYPTVRYVREPKPGLDWARNRAITECRGDILAYTDDDVVVDPAWAERLAAVFEADAAVMAVTGLVVPFELETRAQQLFELYGGFGRGFRRRWFRARPGRPAALELGGAGAFGTGANMAYRRRVFDLVGPFDPAMDVGTRTNGGGDLEMFFRVLKHGHALVYEPAAIVRHRHRRDYAALRTQIANNGIGFYAYLARVAQAYPDERMAIARLAIWWFSWWSLRRLARTLMGRERIPLDLILVELFGSLRGPSRYRQSRQRAGALAEPPVAPPAMRQGEAEAVRRVDIAGPLRALDDISGHRRVHVFVFRNGVPLGRVQIESRGAVISVAELQDAIVLNLPEAVVDPTGQPALPALTAPALPPQTITVVLATRNRPDDLRACLASLVAQRTRHTVEIIVVDNDPASGITPPVVRDFPSARLVNEARPGLSYARNRGILAASGEIIATTDDDVVCPPEWLERLIAPMARPEVVLVTGNVLPASLDTASQQMFETYGGLGRGFRSAEFDPAWMARCRRSVPTWEIGCTANAACRSAIFADARIGLMDEALGAGTPTGCSEDTLVFYQVLAAGHTIVYEPRAFVWHTHRRAPHAFQHQLYSYSKGHIAYQLTTLVRYRDLRALARLVFELPVSYARRAALRLLRRTDYPLRFMALELLGNLAGPWALWRSRRRVRALGRSSPDRSSHAVHVEGARA